MEDAPSQTASATPNRAYLSVTRLPDGRYCVVYNDHALSRRSYAREAKQVIRQAQYAGHIPIHTDDDLIRQCCAEANVPLL